MYRKFIYVVISSVMVACGDKPAVNDESNLPQEPTPSVENLEWTDISDQY